MISTAVGPRRWWRVIVHDTLEELREAAYQHRKRDGLPREHWQDTEGCCHPAGRYYEDKPHHSWPRNGYRGIIRYAQESLTAEIVAHELVHAAVATLRSFVNGDVRLGDGYRGSLLREEQLAYIYGELFDDLNAQL